MHAVLVRNRCAKSLVAPDIHNPDAATFLLSLQTGPSKPARSTFRVSRNKCTLLLAKELVGNREVTRRLDNCLHTSLVLH
jgi:hypothetical protein